MNLRVPAYGNISKVIAILLVAATDTKNTAPRLHPPLANHVFGVYGHRTTLWDMDDGPRTSFSRMTRLHG
jgi:hypothetical protein